MCPAEAPARDRIAVPADGARFLETAERIGQRLADDAIWYEDRCSWIGGDPIEREGRQRGLSYSALGPTLYSGTSGVALFLADLHAATGDRAAARTALGAIRHALARVDAIAPPDRIGLHTGWAGIALAAARVAMILDAADVRDRAVGLTQRLVEAPRSDAGFDLIAGRAGAIVALLELGSLLDDSSLLDSGSQLDAVVRMGDELLESAERKDAKEAGCSWRSPAYPRWRNLTGFSHGTAGAGLALLELFAATGEQRFLDTARAAFAYERHWFDPEAGNWPDFRETPRRRARPTPPLSFATFWCHGAPGIALSRLRAQEIIPDAALRSEANVALATTRRAIKDTLHAGTGNFSLCHGIAGNAAVLLESSRLTGRDASDDARIAIQAADFGRRLYDGTGQPWPCGTHAGETPNLMLGLAGIGYFYLRLADPAVLSVLVTGAGRAGALERRSSLGSTVRERV